jgi:hypothetical protein
MDHTCVLADIVGQDFVVEIASEVPTDDEGMQKWIASDRKYFPFAVQDSTLNQILSLK